MEINKLRRREGLWRAQENNMLNLRHSERVKYPRERGWQRDINICLWDNEWKDKWMTKWMNVKYSSGKCS